MMLVTLEQARAQIRVDQADDDVDLTLKIKAVSKAIVRYLKDPEFADSSGQIPVDTAGVALDVPEDIQLACLVEVAERYRNRDGDESGPVDTQFGYGYPLCRAAIGLLYPMRVPTTSAPMVDLTLIDRPWWWRWWGCGCG